MIKMKLIRALNIIFLLVIITACDDDFLERYPLDRLSPETYFNSEQDLRTSTNSFYTAFPGDGDIVHPTLSDHHASSTVPQAWRGLRRVPTTGGGWSWGRLRNINFFLENVDRFEGDPLIKNHYIGVARFFRAYFYSDMVRRFGDVPWYSHVIEADDTESLTKSRDSRIMVMDKVLEDIDYAIEHLRDSPSINRVTKWTALALKSRIFLFEGTFRKYHGLGDYERMLDESISASLELMQNSGYTIYTSTPDKAYHELFIAKDAIADEVILAREYDYGQAYTHWSTWNTHARPHSATKAVINSYLMADGSRFTDIPGYDRMQFYDECQNRDPRLAQTIRTPGYTEIGEDEIQSPELLNGAITGYHWKKFVLSPIHFYTRDDNDLPIFRYAEILLNFAEAKAERGNLTQADLDNSIKLIRDRVGMPNIDMAWANSNPDPFLEDQYQNVTGANKGVILEIRRERAIEFIREGRRMDDLMRWKEGHLLVRPWRGMYFPGPGEYDFQNDGEIDFVIYEGSMPSEAIPGAQYMSLDDIDLEHGRDGGNIIPDKGTVRLWDENKDYLDPIPIQELTLNPNLTQNPGWGD